jgi:hypothetical protein
MSVANFLIFCLISGSCQDLSGPVFIQEPPNNVDFSNSTGDTFTVIYCRLENLKKNIFKLHSIHISFVITCSFKLELYNNMDIKCTKYYELISKTET